MTSSQAGRIRLAAALAALTAALAACSSGGSSGSSAAGKTTGSAGTAATSAAAPKSSVAAAANTSGPDVCALLSSAQASSINHVTYGAATPKTIAPGWDACTYKNTGKSESPVDIQNLEVDVMNGPDCWQSLEKTPNRGNPVSGIGDAAFGYGIGLAIKDGSRCVQVEGLTFAELKGDYSRDIAMAKIVMGKLS